MIISRDEIIRGKLNCKLWIVLTQEGLERCRGFPKRRENYLIEPRGLSANKSLEWQRKCRWGAWVWDWTQGQMFSKWIWGKRRVIGKLSFLIQSWKNYGLVFLIILLHCPLCVWFQITSVRPEGYPTLYKLETNT